MFHHASLLSVTSITECFLKSSKLLMYDINFRKAIILGGAEMPSGVPCGQLRVLTPNHVKKAQTTGSSCYEGE